MRLVYKGRLTNRKNTNSVVIFSTRGSGLTFELSKREPITLNTEMRMVYIPSPNNEARYFELEFFFAVLILERRR